MKNTRFEPKERAVGRLGKAIGKITGLFRKPEPEKEPEPVTPIGPTTEQEAAK